MPGPLVPPFGPIDLDKSDAVAFAVVDQELTGPTGAIYQAIQASGGGGDFLASLVNAIASLTNADGNLAASTLTFVKATTGAHTVSLPAPVAKRLAGLLVTSDSTQLITLQGHAGELIDGLTTRVMWAGESAFLISDGTNWFKIGGKSLPMACELFETSPQTVNTGGVHAIAFDTTVTDNTGLMANLGSAQVNILRPAVYRMSVMGFYTPASLPMAFIGSIVPSVGGNASINEIFTAGVSDSVYTVQTVQELAGGSNVIVQVSVSFSASMTLGDARFAVTESVAW